MKKLFDKILANEAIQAGNWNWKFLSRFPIGSDLWSKMLISFQFLA